MRSASKGSSGPPTVLTHPDRVGTAERLVAGQPVGSEENSPSAARQWKVSSIIHWVPAGATADLQTKNPSCCFSSPTAMVLRLSFLQAGCGPDLLRVSGHPGGQLHRHKKTHQFFKNISYKPVTFQTCLWCLEDTSFIIEVQ